MAKARPTLIQDPESLLSSLMNFHDNELQIPATMQRPQRGAPVLPPNLPSASDQVLSSLLAHYASWLEFLRAQRAKRVAYVASVEESLARTRNDRLVYYRDEKPAAIRDALVEDDPDVSQLRILLVNGKAEIKLITGEISRMYASHETVKKLIDLRLRGQHMDRKVRQTGTLYASGNDEERSGNARTIRKPRKMRRPKDSGLVFEQGNVTDELEDDFGE